MTEDEKKLERLYRKLEKKKVFHEMKRIHASLHKKSRSRLK